MQPRSPKPALLLLTTLLCALPIPAQESNIPGAGFDHPKPTPQQSTAPTLHVYTRETVVDVTVTDAKGSPVHGLTRDDFTVKEDGKPQPIRSFHEYTSQPAKPLPTLPPNTYANRQPPPPSPAVNILLLDFVNGAPDGSTEAGSLDQPKAIELQHLVKKEAIQYIRQMPAGIRVAVIAMYWPDSFRILQGVTSDPALLAAAIDALDYAIEPVAEPVKVEMTLESLKQLAPVAEQIHGRKNLIWFTYTRPAMTEQEVCAPKNCPDWPHKFQIIVGFLADAGVTIYPIGARGLPVPPNPAAQLLSLETIAEEGGGIAYYNANDLVTGIAKAVAAGSDFYSLSYIPPGTKFDGRHHTIKVDATPPRMHLTYRDSYYAEDPAKLSPVPVLTLATQPGSAPADMHAAMGRTMPTATQLLFDVKFAPTTSAPGPTDPPIIGFPAPEFKSKPLTRYDILYTIPPDQLTFTTAPDGTRTDSVQFDVVASDVFGKLITSVSRTMQLPFSPDEYAHFLQSPFQFLQQIDLPAGQSFVRIGILDQSSNRIGTIEIPLTVAKLSAAKPNAALAPGGTNAP
jgi:VWFA-related protein